MAYYSLGMAYSCLEMVSNIMFVIFGNCHGSTKFRNVYPLFIAEILKKKKSRVTILCNITFVNMDIYIFGDSWKPMHPHFHIFKIYIRNKTFEHIMENK